MEFAETFVFSQSARIVGGDLIHTLVRPDGGLALAVGDVSGKGISAALIMAMVQGLLGVLHELGQQVGELPAVINRNLNRYGVGHRYVTLAAGVLFPDGRFELTNAGHAPVSILRQRRAGRHHRAARPDAGAARRCGLGVGRGEARARTRSW